MNGCNDAIPVSKQNASKAVRTDSSSVQKIQNEDGSSTASPATTESPEVKDGFSSVTPEPLNDLEHQAGVPIREGRIVWLKIIAKDITIDHENKIKLNESEYLQLEADGKMHFRGGSLQNYIMLTNLGNFIVYSSDGKPLGVIKAGEGNERSLVYQPNLTEQERKDLTNAANLVCGCNK